MRIYPAIDLCNKQCVNLVQGDFDKKVVFDNNPLNVAFEFEKKGCEYLHLVDLDQAKSGDKVNEDIISDIVNKTELKVQVGGGIKTREDVIYYLNLGVERLIIGSLAITDFELTCQLIKEFKDKIIVSVDVLNSEVFYKGWLSNSKILLDDLCKRLVLNGLKTLIVTDISRDGMMEGIDITLYEKLRSSYPIEIVAAGGVSTDDDLKKLKEIGINGAIIGKALYINTIKLDEIIKEN